MKIIYRSRIKDKLIYEINLRKLKELQKKINRKIGIEEQEQ